MPGCRIQTLYLDDITDWVVFEWVMSGFGMMCLGAGGGEGRGLVHLWPKCYMLPGQHN